MYKRYSEGKDEYRRKDLHESYNNMWKLKVSKRNDDNSRKKWH